MLNAIQRGELRPAERSLDATMADVVSLLVVTPLSTPKRILTCMEIVCSCQLKDFRERLAKGDFFQARIEWVMESASGAPCSRAEYV